MTRRTTDVPLFEIRDPEVFDRELKKAMKETLDEMCEGPVVDDNGMIVGTISTVAELDGLLKIQTARREAGPWCYSAMAIANGNVFGEAWKGSYPTRAEAAIAAGMDVDDWTPMPHTLKSKTQRENLNAVLAELEKLDKWMRAELKESKSAVP